MCKFLPLKKLLLYQNFFFLSIRYINLNEPLANNGIILRSNKQHVLITIRFIVIGGFIIKDGNNKIIKLSLTMNKKSVVYRTIEKIRKFYLSLLFLMTNLGLIFHLSLDLLLFDLAFLLLSCIF